MLELFILFLSAILQIVLSLAIFIFTLSIILEFFICIFFGDLWKKKIINLFNKSNVEDKKKEMDKYGV